MPKSNKKRKDGKVKSKPRFTPKKVNKQTMLFKLAALMLAANKIKR